MRNREERSHCPREVSSARVQGSRSSKMVQLPQFIGSSEGNIRRSHKKCWERFRSRVDQIRERGGAGAGSSHAVQSRERTVVCRVLGLELPKHHFPGCTGSISSSHLPSQSEGIGLGATGGRRNLCLPPGGGLQRCSMLETSISVLADEPS